jgi:hypothetical protein
VFVLNVGAMDGVEVARARLKAAGYETVGSYDELVGVR